MRNRFGDLADAGYLLRSENLFPIIEAGAAVQFYGIGFVPGKFGGILRTAGVEDRAFDSFVEIQAEGFVQSFETGQRVQGEVFVADDVEVREQFSGRMNAAMNQPPEQGRLTDHIPGAGRFHFGAVLFQVIAHEQGLVEQVVEIKRPVQAFEAADHRGGMADGNDHPAIQFFCKPGSRENREGVFEQGALAAHGAIEENAKIAAHAKKILDRADGFYFQPGVVLEIEQFMKCRQVLRLVFGVDVGVPVFDRGAEHAGTVQHIQRLADIGGIGIGGKHFADPGCAAAVRTCDEDGTEIIHSSIPIYLLRIWCGRGSIRRRNNLPRKHSPNVRGCYLFPSHGTRPKNWE